MLFVIIFISMLILIPILAIASEHDENKKYEKEMAPFEKENNAMACIKCNHITGLELTENKECIISFCEDKIVIQSDSSKFKLDISKIIDMNVKTSQEIQNSISEAAVGYLLLGTVGTALMGSQRQISRVFYILYIDKENKDKCIAFNLGDNITNLKYTNKYIDAFNTQVRKKKEIEL